MLQFKAMSSNDYPFTPFPKAFVKKAPNPAAHRPPVECHRRRNELLSQLSCTRRVPGPLAF